MRRIGVAQRRARLGVRHRLAPGTRAATPAEAADAVVALHGTDPATVYLAVRARADVKPEGVDRAIYDERTLVRMLGMRRTVFTVPVDLAGVVQASSTRAVAARERQTLHKLLAGAQLPGGVAEWVADLERATLAALTARGEATAAELSADVPLLGHKVLLAAGKPYEAWQNVSTRILALLAADGHIVRGRPRGSWISTQFRWSPAEVWLPGGIPSWSVADAQVELVRRWLAAFGPGTVADLKWWTGWTVAEVRRALGRLDTEEVDLDDATGVVLAGDADDEPAAPWIALLPALDPTAMGWASREWYLGDHGPLLFDRSGNVGPTVWCDGRIVGGWAQRPDGEVMYRLLDDIGAEATAAVADEAARVRDWIGDVRVTPRFRTPLERELSR